MRSLGNNYPDTDKVKQKMSKYKSALKDIINAPSVQIGFGAAICIALLLLTWKIKQKVKQKQSVTAYGIKGDGEITEARAKMLAESLYLAMKLPATDEATIEKVYDELCNHEKAVLQVHEAFGLVSYALWGYGGLLGVKLNLRQWLKRELSTKEFAKWELLYNNASNV